MPAEQVVDVEATGLSADGVHQETVCKPCASGLGAGRGGRKKMMSKTLCKRQ